MGSQARAQTPATIGLKTAVNGQRVKLQSYNVQDSYLRHYFFLGNLNRIETAQEINDSTFKINTGLAGKGVSFESVNFPGMYLRHFLFRLTLMLRTPDLLFPNDASFERVPGLADPSWVSLQSVNYPGFYLRHRGSEFWLEAKGTDAQYLKDATFKIIVVN
ncbi:MAG TPA: AbfB domain-containing protein [Kofleriaceae bacterium]|nr:AbfB domain-containing protein [Kofleriaceae bacterium]